MRAKECVIWCDCEKGQLFKTSLQSRDGMPAIFWLTEDECIYFRGKCSHCNQEIEYKYPILRLLMDCPNDKPVN